MKVIKDQLRRPALNEGLQKKRGGLPHSCRRFWRQGGNMCASISAPTQPEECPADRS